jgi:signal transduction histidine kinase
VHRRLDESTLRELFDVSQGLVSDLELEEVLKRVVEAAVQITGARYAALGVLNAQRTGLDRFIHVGIDEETRERIGDLPHGRGVLGLLISEPRPVRLPDVSAHPSSYGFPPGHPPMRTFLGVPIRILERQWGNLYLTEKAGGEEFTAEDEGAVVTLAEWAAIAIGNARSVATERLRLAMDAAEHERRQWARELHDETLQGLAAVRLMLATGRRDTERLADAVDRSIEQIDFEIAAMRNLITDLRPDSLQELGIVPALGALAARIESRSAGVEIQIETPEVFEPRLPPPSEIAIYRVVQESITNAIRHGGAARIRVLVKQLPDGVEVIVRDDGAGFVPERAEFGFGIVGMRERAELAEGHIDIESRPGNGATVTLKLPLG